MDGRCVEAGSASGQAARFSVWRQGFDSPTRYSHVLALGNGVTGNMPGFDPGECRFEPCFPSSGLKPRPVCVRIASGVRGQGLYRKRTGSGPGYGGEFHRDLAAPPPASPLVRGDRAGGTITPAGPENRETPPDKRVVPARVAQLVEATG